MRTSASSWWETAATCTMEVPLGLIAGIGLDDGAGDGGWRTIGAGLALCVTSLRAGVVGRVWARCRLPKRDRGSNDLGVRIPWWRRSGCTFFRSRGGLDCRVAGGGFEATKDRTRRRLVRGCGGNCGGLSGGLAAHGVAKPEEDGADERKRKEDSQDGAGAERYLAVVRSLVAVIGRFAFRDGELAC